MVRPVSKYYVHYDGNGAVSGTVPEKTGTAGGSCALAGNTGNLAKPGYVFAGWSESAGGAAVTHVTVNGSDRTVYAVWKVNTYSVILVNGPTDTSYFTATYDSPVLTGFNAPVRAGSVFNGYWSSQTDGSMVVTPDGKYVLSVQGYTAAGKWINLSQCTLYARWANPMDTAVNLDLNGTTYGSTSIVVGAGSTSVPADYVKPMRYEYEFLGYFTGTSGGSLVIGADGMFRGGVDGVTLAGGEWAYQGREMTLYAMWRASTSPDPGPAPGGKATYHANGGLFPGNVETVETVRYITFDELPVRDGFRFLGWAETADAAEPKYTEPMQNIPVYSDIVLYTVWEPVNEPAPETQSKFFMYVFPWIVLILAILAYCLYRRWKADRVEQTS